MLYYWSPCKVYSVHCTMYTLYSLQCSMYIVKCTASSCSKCYIIDLSVKFTTGPGGYSKDFLSFDPGFTLVFLYTPSYRYFTYTHLVNSRTGGYRVEQEIQGRTGDTG